MSTIAAKLVVDSIVQARTGEELSDIYYNAIKSLSPESLAYIEREVPFRFALARSAYNSKVGLI